MKPPRNVTGYYVQELDGCANCIHRYFGMVTDSFLPVPACKLACSNPAKPSYCDEISLFGKCDAWAKNEPKKGNESL